MVPAQTSPDANSGMDIRNCIKLPSISMKTRAWTGAHFREEVQQTLNLTLNPLSWSTLRWKTIRFQFPEQNSWVKNQLWVGIVWVKCMFHYDRAKVAMGIYALSFTSRRSTGILSNKNSVTWGLQAVYFCCILHREPSHIDLSRKWVTSVSFCVSSHSWTSTTSEVSDLG